MANGGYNPYQQIGMLAPLLNLVPGGGQFAQMLFQNPGFQYGLSQAQQQAYGQAYDWTKAMNIGGYNQAAGLLGAPQSPATPWLNQWQQQQNPPQQPGGGFTPPAGGGSFLSNLPWFRPRQEPQWSATTTPSQPGAAQAQPAQQSGMPGVGGGLYGRVMPQAQQLAQEAQAYYGQAGPRWQQAMQPIQQGWGRLGGQLAGQGQGILGLAGQRAQQGQQAYGGLLGGWQGLTGQAMGALQGAGAQERQDINRQFNQLQGGAMSDLVSRGLRGSTIAPGVSAGIERERAGALGGLNERLLQQRLGLMTGLGGQALGAQERGIGFGAGLTADQMNAMANQQAMTGQFGQNRLGALGGMAQGGLGYMDAARAASMQAGMLPLGYDIDLTGQQVGLIQSAQYPYPPMPQPYTYSSPYG